MKYFGIIICLFFTLSSSTCSSDDDRHYSFTFKNSSNKSIAFQYNEYYPDTLWHCGSNGEQRLVVHNLSPGETYTFSLSRTSLEEDFNRLKKRGADYLQLIVVDSAVYKTSTCDLIRANNLVLKRYQIDIATLEQNNWIITYP